MPYATHLLFSPVSLFSRGQRFCTVPGPASPWTSCFSERCPCNCWCLAIIVFCKPKRELRVMTGAGQMQFTSLSPNLAKHMHMLIMHLLHCCSSCRMSQTTLLLGIPSSHLMLTAGTYIISGTEPWHMAMAAKLAGTVQYTGFCMPLCYTHAHLLEQQH